MVQVGPKCNHECPYKTEAEGDMIPRHTEEKVLGRQRLEGTVLEGGRVGATG